jgi:scyllo-inositol 2-dehydrogenase (NADP+)
LTILKVGLIGFGLAGRAFHAPVVRGVAGLELTCILERSGNLAQQEYPQIRVARSLEELLSDPEIRLCVVATPNDSHFDLAKACLLAGRDVVVDKPLAPTWKECTHLVALAKQQGRVLTVFQNRRWDGDFRTVQNLISSGALGSIAEYEARYDRFRPEPKAGAWRDQPTKPGAGALFDLGPHLIDQALVLFGEPQTITASALRQRESSQVDDAFDVCMAYPRLRAILKARIIAFGPGPHLTIHGTRGSFIKYGMDPQEEMLRGNNRPTGADWGQDWGLDPEQNWGTLSQVGGPSHIVATERGDYRGFYENVRDAIERGAPLEVTPEQALRTMKAILLAHKSSRLKRTVEWTENPD